MSELPQLDNLLAQIFSPPKRRRGPAQTRWVAIQPDGSRYVMHKKDGAWYYRPGAGSGPGIEQAIEDAREEGIQVVKEEIPAANLARGGRGIK